MESDVPESQEDIENAVSDLCGKMFVHVYPEIEELAQMTPPDTKEIEALFMQESLGRETMVLPEYQEGDQRLTSELHESDQASEGMSSKSVFSANEGSPLLLASKLLIEYKEKLSQDDPDLEMVVPLNEIKVSESELSIDKVVETWTDILESFEMIVGSKEPINTENEEQNSLEKETEDTPNLLHLWPFHRSILNKENEHPKKKVFKSVFPKIETWADVRVRVLEGLGKLFPLKQRTCLNAEYESISEASCSSPDLDDVREPPKLEPTVRESCKFQRNIDKVAAAIAKLNRKRKLDTPFVMPLPKRVKTLGKARPKKNLNRATTQGRRLTWLSKDRNSGTIRRADFSEHSSNDAKKLKLSNTDPDAPVPIMTLIQNDLFIECFFKNGS